MGITILTQLLFYGFLLWYPAEQLQFTLFFSPLDFFLLILCSNIIMAGGYIINDVIDYHADLINKKEKMIIDRNITRSVAMQLYTVLNFIGIILALSLAWRMKDAGLGALLIGTIYLLYLYSKFLQSIPLIGNLTVAFLCALVIWIIMVAGQMDIFFLSNENTLPIAPLFWAFGLFAFLATLWRELIKDLEDIEGDLKSGVKTLASIWHGKISKVLCISLGIFMGTALLYFSSQSRKYLDTIGTWYIFGLIITTLFITFYIYRAQEKKEFGQISFWIKLYLLQGMFLIIFCHV